MSVNVSFKNINEALPKNGREIQYILTNNDGLNIFGALGHVGDFCNGVVRYSLVNEEGDSYDVEEDEDYTPGQSYTIDGEVYTCQIYLGKEEALGDELVYPNEHLTLYWCDVAEVLRSFFGDRVILNYIKEGVEDGVMDLTLTSKEKIEYEQQFNEVFWSYKADLLYKGEVHKLWAFSGDREDYKNLDWNDA